jgi:hypothetical protein
MNLSDHLLAQWQTLWELPPAERLDRIDFIRRSMPRPFANDDDTPSQAIVRREMSKPNEVNT